MASALSRVRPVRDGISTLWPLAVSTTGSFLACMPSSRFMEMTVPAAAADCTYSTRTDSTPSARRALAEVSACWPM